MKQHWTKQLQKCSDMMPRKVIDESAETVEEIAKSSGSPICHVQRTAKKMVAAGKWEQVWKMGSRTLVPAYRLKQ